MSAHAKQRIGLLGGSFNPAHAGHVHISLEAMKRLKLDGVWWLVSPANPLKNPLDYAPFEQRMRDAKTITSIHPNIAISDIEQRINTRYSIDTINYLKMHHPHIEFIWLMGADNLVSFHKWKAWQNIIAHIPIAVFNRAPFAHRALRSKAAYFARQIGKPIAFFFIQTHPASSTKIRKRLEKEDN
jgi:nicotinate-nucleotide adenylyltransferase